MTRSVTNASAHMTLTKRIITVLALLLPAAPFGVAAQESDGGHVSDTKAIRGVIERYAHTWNANDMTAWGELFTHDVDYVHRGGGWWKSNQENVAGHRKIHKRLARENQEMNLQLAVAGIDYLGSGIALAHVTSRWPRFKMPNRQGEELNGIMTMVMVQQGNTWRIRALHNTIVSHPNP